MEFNVKLQELRKQKGLTQDELAEVLFVSRTAISKWESGRGYPSIDSLKAISKFFKVTIDGLLSGDELLSLAEEDSKKKVTCMRDPVFGLTDCSMAMLLFLPFFGQKTDGLIRSVSLLSLTGISPWLKTSYLVIISITALWGILTLALQSLSFSFWKKTSNKLSLILNALALLLFTVSMQPYAASFLFILLAIKVSMLIKWR